MRAHRAGAEGHAARLLLLHPRTRRRPLDLPERVHLWGRRRLGSQHLPAEQRQQGLLRQVVEGRSRRACIARVFQRGTRRQRSVGVCTPWQAGRHVWRYASVASRSELLEQFVADEKNADELRGQDFNVTPMNDNPVVIARSLDEAGEDAEPGARTPDVPLGALMNHAVDGLQPPVGFLLIRLSSGRGTLQQWHLTN